MPNGPFRYRNPICEPPKRAPKETTLANWVGGACWWLEPLQARVAAHVFGSAKIFADDTPIPVLDPGRGRLIMLYRARQSAATRRPAAPTVKNHAHEAARGQRHVRRAARLRRHRPRAAGARGGFVLEQLAPARRGRATARRRRGEARARCSRQARTGSPQAADHADGAVTPLRAVPMGCRPCRVLE